MRLTLRTLLAYMDDILEPADHEDLGKKVESSDFATELIHRSRDTVRRLRLGAPPVLAEESGDVLDSLDLGDANVVAEYIDNTLPPEQVAEFERMCLESGTQADMHLAEVASCHHVLTMVLGEPAEVDAGLKARLYQLPAELAKRVLAKEESGSKLRVEPAHQQPHVAPPVPPARHPAPFSNPAANVAANDATNSVESELPDYLREAVVAKRRSRRWTLAAVCLASAGALVFWFASAPPPTVPLDVVEGGSEFFDGEIDIEVSGDLSMESFAQQDDSAGDAPVFSPAAPAEETPANQVTASEPLVGDDPSELGPPATDLPAGDSPAEFTAAGPQPTLDSAVRLPQESSSQPADLADIGAVAPAQAAAAQANSSVVGEPAGETPLRVASLPGGERTDGPEGLPPASVEEAVDLVVESEAAALGPQQLGTYMGNNDLLLVYDSARDKWIRRSPRSPIATGDLLLTLPKFRRAHVVLADVNTYLWGGTRLHLPMAGVAGSSAEGALNLEVVYGRLQLNAGLSGSPVTVLMGDQVRQFQLEGSASLAVEVERVFLPGSDYENEAAPIRATWYLTSGSVQWPTPAGGVQTIVGQSVWRTIDGIDEIPEAVATYPEWIDREPVTDVERTARDNLDGELVVGEPVDIRLLELTDGKGLGRRKEVRILAASAGIFIGEFEPLVKALNDSEQDRAWENLIEALRQALALSPENATRVRQAFVNIRGEQAAEDLMEMVNGYRPEQIGQTPEEIQAGALSQLIKWLDHDSLDYRVLAIHNIQQITGKSKGYRPDDSLKRRKSSLRKIWADFESGELLNNP